LSASAGLSNSLRPSDSPPRFPPINEQVRAIEHSLRSRPIVRYGCTTPPAPVDETHPSVPAAGATQCPHPPPDWSCRGAHCLPPPASNLSLALGRDMRQASKGMPLNTCREAPQASGTRIASRRPPVAASRPAIRVAPVEGSHPPEGAPPVADPQSRPVATSPDVPRPAEVASTPQAAYVPLLGSALPVDVVAARRLTDGVPSVGAPTTMEFERSKLIQILLEGIRGLGRGGDNVLALSSVRYNGGVKTLTITQFARMGGKARANKLTPEQLSAIGKMGGRPRKQRRLDSARHSTPNP